MTIVVALLASPEGDAAFAEAVRVGAVENVPVTVVTGVVFMVCVLLFRRGIVGELADTRLGRLLGLR